MRKKLIVVSILISMLAASMPVYAEPSIALDSTNEANQKTLNSDGNAERESLLSFKDIQGHWAESSIRSAINKGIVSGYPNGMFYPENKVTRAEFLKIVIGSLGYETESTTSGAPWYKAYVAAAKLNQLYA
ncbi:S-layer homology domain-containing protein, partial [Paenibacillus silvae]|uniref:S-layer homology domain-containing protein n=1 Tax=Paenibacillus silvae TaxID=1325358 RepID=UPI0025A1611D